MQANHKEPNHNITHFINNILTDLKNLTNALRPLSRQAVDANNSLINKLLLGNDRDSLQIIKDMLSHLLHIVDLKGINPLIMGILTKIIAFIKIIESSESKNEETIFIPAFYSQEMSTIIYHLIDLIFLLKNRYKDVDMALRIIQTTFSLIDARILQYANYNLFTRIYSICFDCCLSSPLIQNISVSALFALTEIIFSSPIVEDSTPILKEFLEFLFNNKKLMWIKQQQFKGMVWDLVIIAVKNFPITQCTSLFNNQNLKSLLHFMYKTSIQKVFIHGEETSKNQSINAKKQKKENDKSISFKKGIFPQFVRFYKSFVYFSIHLSLRTYPDFGQFVNFRENLQLFKILNEFERSSKLYILLQGVSLLLDEGSNILIEDDKGIILLDVFSKIAEELCLQLVPIDLTIDRKDFYLEKMCGDFHKISDSHYAKLIKNSIINLRKKFQKSIENRNSEGQLKSERSEISQKSQLQTSQSRSSSQKKRWERLIKTIIKIIRYLTSLNMNETLNEQIVRKLIIQLQHWFLICPSNKTRNFILQEILNISTLIDTKLQAIKVSQCVQIGSNIIYGYYDILDSLGLTILMKMMAGVKTNWEDGKGFQELDEVCLMSQKLYEEQRLVQNQRSFSKTIQAFIQCSNSMLADIQQPTKQQQRIKKTGKNPQDKFLKMIDYIFSKLQLILEQNIEYLSNQWNFLTGFWISFCSSRIPEIKLKTMSHIGTIIRIILKKSQIEQQLILSPYLQLSKLHMAQISKMVISQLKQILLIINSEMAIIQVFRIVKIILQSKSYKQYQQQVYELQEMLIKQSIFKVKSKDHLIFIIDSMAVINGDKNEEYKIVNLMWNISDHLKLMSSNQELKDSQVVWRKLFNKILSLGLHSIHGETKQSCIHTFTQIIAELNIILGANLFTSILKQIYLELFFVLLGINEKSPKIENIGQAEMMKVAIKNMIKIIKKCIHEKFQNISELLQSINEHICSYIKSEGQTITIQYAFEMCQYFQFLKVISKSQSEKHLLNMDLVKQILEEMEARHSNFDKSGLFWRKKYQPIFLQIKKHFVP